jgi:hypothetical protein
MHTYRAASPGTDAAGDAPNLALDRARKSISSPEGLRGTGVAAETLSTKRGLYASPVLQELMLALVLFSTLGQTCDDLVVGATAMLNSTGLGGFAFCRCATLRLSKGRRTTAGSKATKADVSLQARVPARVYSYLL